MFSLLVVQGKKIFFVVEGKECSALQKNIGLRTSMKKCSFATFPFRAQSFSEHFNFFFIERNQ